MNKIIPNDPVASRLYVGEGGLLYWQRNKEHVLEMANDRRAFIRSLYPTQREQVWCEVGCGVRANIYPSDLGIDVDARLDPDITASILDLPLPDESISVMLCVGLLMHLPAGHWQVALREMARCAQDAIIIGEYVSMQDSDLYWDWHNGEMGWGDKGLLWERPYPAPDGWREVARTINHRLFPYVTFLVFTPTKE